MEKYTHHLCISGGNAPFALVHEAFREMKPSLSSFADEPDKVRAYMHASTMATEESNPPQNFFILPTKIEKVFVSPQIPL